MFLSTVAFRATKISTTLRVDVPVAIKATKNLKDTMLPPNNRSWQCSFSELPKSCQLWELTFLSTSAFRAAKIPTTFRADFPVVLRATLKLEDTMLSVNFQSWELQMSYKISVNLRVDIPYMVTLEKRKFLELPQNLSNTFSLRSLS